MGANQVLPITQPKVNMKLSVRIVFVIFVLSLLFSVVAGLFVVWNPDSISPALGQTIATSVIIMLAAVLYLGVCDAVIRIKSDPGKLR